MTKWKYGRLMIVMAVLTLVINICIADKPETSSKVEQAICNPKTDSVVNKENQADAEHSKIIGKGVYTLEEQNNIPGFMLIYPLFGRNAKPSELMEFAQKKSESEIADDALLFAAKKCLRVKKIEQGVDILNTIIERYPNSAQVDEMVLLVQLLAVPQPDPTWIKKKTDRIKSHLCDYPNFTVDEALRRKAFYLETLGKRAEATRLLEGYVEKHPRGRWANEDEKVRKLVQPYPFRRTDELIYHHLAWLYIQNGDHAKAVNPLKQAIKTFVGSQHVLSYHDLLAKAYRKTGDTKQEITALLHLQELVRSKGYLVYVEGDDRVKFPPHEHWRTWLRVRSTERIEQRLAKLEGKAFP